MALTTIAPQITSAGISAPTYYEIVDYLKEQYKAIYGDDAYLENDSMDGQWIGIIARAIADCNAATISLYSSFSPKTATGDALTRNVAINGIQRALPTHSTVDLTLIGIAGTTITDGYAVDQNSKRWNLPSRVTIPSEGSITVTATAAEAGSVLAQVNTINNIGKPTRGWQSVTNIATSTLGNPLETDAELKQRQALSVALSSISIPQALEGALLSLLGVSRCKIIENKTAETTADGLPPHSVCAIVQGGSVDEIAMVINSKKSMGCALYGNTSETVSNAYGLKETIQFFRPKLVSIGYRLQLSVKDAYSSDLATQIRQNLALYTNQLDVNDRITLNKLYGVANLYGDLDSESYEVEVITIIADGVSVVGNYSLPFGCIANCISSDIEIEINNG